jgi:hypothetical protein
MTNDLIPQKPDDDDGYGGSLTPSQSIKNYARWTDTAGWFDRDGQPLPAAMLAPAINEGLRKWKNNVADFIWDKPLPDPQQLNNTIPKSEWEKGLNSNELRPPWEKIIAVILVDPSTGAVFRYTSSTVGARIAFDALREAVVTMRMLRGTKVIPLVNLGERPFKTNFGMKKRPHFQVVGWKSPGEDDKAIATKPAPQLSGPTAAAAPQTPAAPAAAPTSAPETAVPYQAKPKPPVSLASDTLATMGDVKPATTSEILDDSVPW